MIRIVDKNKILSVENQKKKKNNEDEGDVNFMQSITKQNGHVSDFDVYEE